MTAPDLRSTSRASSATRLVLFDIDGTLLLSDGAGRRAIHRALIEIFGNTGPADHRFDGKTDPQIVRELMRSVGHEDAHIDERMEELFARYVACLREELDDPQYHAAALPGVPALLDALAQRTDVALGLLTGNLVDGARAKLHAVGIDPVQFGIIVTINLGIGQQTPPVASVLTVACSIARADMWEVTKVNVWFIAALLVVLILSTYVPIVPLGLVRLFYGSAG